jgi:hypothetical protein
VCLFTLEAGSLDTFNMADISRFNISKITLEGLPSVSNHCTTPISNDLNLNLPLIPAVRDPHWE